MPKDAPEEAPSKDPEVKVPLPPPSTKRRRKGEEPGEKASSEKASSEKPDKGEKPDKSDRVEVILSNGKKLKDSLAELTPDVIWRSKVRATELDRRISRGSGIDRELQKVHTNKQASQIQKERATALQDEVFQLAEAASTMKLAFMAIRNQDGASLADELTGVSSQAELLKNMTKCAHKLLTDSDVVIDIIHTVAKKLIDVLGLAFPALFNGSNIFRQQIN